MTTMDQNDLEITDQHLKNIKLAIEFKYLTKQAPAGVYLLPEVDNIRHLHGVIFLRRGLYADGVFRFNIELPPTYNDKNTHPKVFFTPPVFNPFINMSTGELDLTVEQSMREWNPDKHYLISVLTFLKKAFYARSYDAYARLPNEEARQIYNVDKELFLKKVATAVEESQKRLYDPQPPACTLIFTEPKPAHEELLKKLLSNAQNGENKDPIGRRMDADIENSGIKEQGGGGYREESSVGDISLDSVGLDAFKSPMSTMST